MDIILQITGFCAIAYLLFKFAPNILSAVFKLSVIAIALVLIFITITVYMSDWSYTYA
tara:strand:- start:35 stop:208 length:174 start_codon:yes stop_codon:yes gene_type:complete